MLASPPAVRFMATESSAVAPPPQPATEMRANSVLSRLIEEQSWTEALSRLQTHPSEAAQVIRKPFGDVLPLYEACKLQPPANFVEALVAAFRPAARMPGCHSSSLPVHLAIQTGSKDALAPLICAYPAGARKKDDRGRLPIHLGCEWEAPVAAISALLTLYPESIHVRDANGKSPMDYAIKSKMMGRDVDQIIATLKKGPAYCAVSKSAYKRLKEEFDIVMKNKVKAHEEKLAEIERNQNLQAGIHRQLEEGYRSGLRSMREQADKFQKETQMVEKEKENLKEQLSDLKDAKEVLNAHAESLERSLHEKIAELAEVCSVRELREAQIQEMEERIDSTDMLLGERCSQIDAKDKEICKMREHVESLTRETIGQASKIKEVTGMAIVLEAQLEKSRKEAKEKGSSLRDAVKSIGTLKEDVATKDIQISELSACVADLEAQVKGQCEVIEAKDATIESAHEQIDVLSSNLDSMADLSNEQAKQVSDLISHVELIERRLKKKSADFEETSSALAEAKRRMEVLLRNTDSIARLNGAHVERIGHSNKAIISLSASLNGFILPRDLVEKARAEQAKALGLILGNDDKYHELMGKVSERRMAIVAENQAMEKMFLSTSPVETESITWEHYVPPNGESMVGSTASINFASLEEKETDLAKSIAVAPKPHLLDASRMTSNGEEDDGCVVETDAICVGESDAPGDDVSEEVETAVESEGTDFSTESELDSFDDSSVQDKPECCELVFDKENASSCNAQDRNVDGKISAHKQKGEDSEKYLEDTDGENTLHKASQYQRPQGVQEAIGQGYQYETEEKRREIRKFLRMF